MIFDSIRVRLPSLLDNWTLKLLYGLLLPLSSLLANRCANRRLLFSSALLCSLLCGSSSPAGSAVENSVCRLEAAC